MIGSATAPSFWQTVRSITTISASLALLVMSSAHKAASVIPRTPFPFVRQSPVSSNLLPPRLSCHPRPSSRLHQSFLNSPSTLNGLPPFITLPGLALARPSCPQSSTYPNIRYPVSVPLWLPLPLARLPRPKPSRPLPPSTPTLPLLWI